MHPAWRTSLVLWNNEDDRMLLGVYEKLRQEAGGDDPRFADVALALTETSGRPYTADQVRNRLRRINESIRAHETAQVISVDEREWADLESPQDGFVGLRMAFFDIETTNLGAIMGRLLCWSIADNWGNITNSRYTDYDQDSPLDDRGVCVALREELERYDIIVGWNSSNFDASFLNARLLRWGERPLRQDIIHNDPMYKARQGKYSARIGSSKLDNVSRFFRTSEQKTPLDWDTWNLAAMGDQKALDEVQTHCDQDVLVLRLVWNHLKPLIRSYHR